MAWTTDNTNFTSERGVKSVIEEKVLNKKCVPIEDRARMMSNNEEDLCNCEDLTDPAMVYMLEKRLKLKQMYTFVGDIIIAMNPFTRIETAYTDEMIQKYHGTAEIFKKDASQLPIPHIFFTADNALYNTWELRKNQSIIISGESGAGKTETAKQVVHFIGDVCGGKVAGGLSIENLILQASPILEACGNAKTKRNDNSSRFGKYCSIYFDMETREICGCSNISYLLEKSRVVAQVSDERNFHVFYQFLKGTTPKITALRKKFGLSDDGAPNDCKEFLYVSESGCYDLENKSDEVDYKETEEAVDDLKIDADNMWQIIASLLFMGNAKFFDSKTGLEGTNDGAVLMDSSKCADSKKASALLGLTDEQLTHGVCCKIFPTQAQPIAQKLAVAQHNRSTFCKFVYDRLFLWLIDSVNKSMLESSGGRVTERSIGILDIFGFEKFDKNGLEQLCINFTNERLQYQFNSHVFAQEKALYASEQLPLAKLTEAFERIEVLVSSNQGKWP